MNKVKYTFLLSIIATTCFAQESHEMVGVTKPYNGESLIYINPEVFYQGEINGDLTLRQLQEANILEEVIHHLGAPSDVDHIKHMSADGKHIVMEEKILHYPGFLLYYSISDNGPELEKIELTSEESFLALDKKKIKAGFSSSDIEYLLPTVAKAVEQSTMVIYVAVSGDGGHTLMKNKNGNITIADGIRMVIEKDSFDKVEKITIYL